MLLKLILTGVSKKKRDYAVLFSGLIVVSTIFYMFLSTALNPGFLKGNFDFSFVMVQFCFGLGAFLLAGLTVVYLVFANSFLLQMRKKDYGMYLMLGAKSRKVARLIFLETLVVGVIATLIGIGLGLGLTQVVTDLLVNQLQITLKNFSPFVAKAVWWTLIYFVVMFFIAASFNAIKLTKTPVVKLLHENARPGLMIKNKVVTAALGLGAAGFLAGGYWLLLSKDLDQTKLGWATGLIVLGSYCFFSATLTLLLGLIRRLNNFTARGLNNFMLGQLQFRFQNYTRVLAALSIFLAMAVGAFAVGLRVDSWRTYALENGGSMITAGYYDMTVSRPNKTTARLIKQLALKGQTTYQTKVKNNTVYFNADEFKQHPFLAYDFTDDGEKLVKMTATTKMSDADLNLTNQLAASYGDNNEIKIVSAKQFAAIKGTSSTFTTLRVQSFKAAYPTLMKLMKAQTKGEASWKSAFTTTRAYAYKLISSIVGGIEFTGFFLGFAFMAMLAATLMFKVLSGAVADRSRYTMLNKLGFSKAKLSANIFKELAWLFVLPAALGSVHVLVGLRIFEGIVNKPYANLWLPFTIFGVLYAIYYVVTVLLYRRIVLRDVQ